MIISQFPTFKAWFMEYVRSFYSEDCFLLKNVKLKEAHSLRVCQNAACIADSEKLDNEGRYIAMTIALLHDTGRFEQITRYRTFKDSESEDHALLGLKVLRSAGVLSILPFVQQELILQAIEHHNKHKVPDGLDSRCLFHTRLVRDADKLDILSILSENYSRTSSSPISSLDMGLPDTSEYSHELLDDIFNGRVATINNIRTCNDLRLARLSWVFDINFQSTMRLVADGGYIDIIAQLLPQDDQIIAARAHLKRYMDTFVMSRD